MPQCLSTKGHNLVCFSFKLLHTKYFSSWPYGFREEDFLSFPHFKSMGAQGLLVSEKKIFDIFSLYKSVGANEPRGVTNLDPRGMVGRIYVGDHLTLLHTKYLSSEPYGFREEDFFKFFSL